MPIIRMGRLRPRKGRNLVLLSALIGWVMKGPLEGVQPSVGTEEEADLQISGPNYGL